MNATEAAAVLNRYLDQLEDLGFAALAARIGEDQAFQAPGESGAAYQLEINILWDHRPNGAIRLLGSVDDGGFSAFAPLTGSRLVRPQSGLPAR